MTFRQAVWLLPLAWALHEAEEWNIMAWYRENFVDPGYFDQIDGPVVWVGLAMMSVIGFIWTAVATLPRNPRIVAWLILPFFVVISLANAFQHIYFQFEFGDYAPGVVTAVLLVIPSVVFIISRAIRNRLVPWWYVAILVVMMFPNLNATVRSGNNVTEPMQNIHKTGIQLMRAIRGQNE
jgi:hypothetical protein